MHFYLKGTDLDPKLENLLDKNLFNSIDSKLKMNLKSSDKDIDYKSKLELNYLYNKYIIYNRIISKSEEACLIELNRDTLGINAESTNVELFKFYNSELTSFVNSKGFELVAAKFSGAFFYPPHKGYMGWHTNYEGFCYRLYITKSLKGDSFFRYFYNGEIVTDYDPIGYSYRFFYVGDKNCPFWHCVCGGSGRYSVGVRLLKI